MQGERKGETAMTNEKIAKILADHTKRLRGEADGKYANFRHADLQGANEHDLASIGTALKKVG